MDSCQTRQKLVLPYPQSVTFAIVSRCFENKNNNCCERKMPFVYLLKMVNKSLIWPPCCRNIPAVVWPEMDLQQLLFLFSKHLDTMANVTDCEYSQTNLWIRL